jgi:hypothetical protein
MRNKKRVIIFLGIDYVHYLFLYELMKQEEIIHTACVPPHQNGWADNMAINRNSCGPHVRKKQVSSPM